MSSWFKKSSDEEEEEHVEADGDDYSAFRRRADEGAIFTSSKCPHAPGLKYSCELPFGLVWTPMAVYKNDVMCGDNDDGLDNGNNTSKTNMPIIKCDGALPPVLCLSCLAYINPFAEVDYKTGIWTCPLCGQDNVVPKKQLRDGCNIMTALNSPFVEYRQSVKPDHDYDDDDDSISKKKKKQKKKKKKVKVVQEEPSDFCTYLLVVDENLSQKDSQAIAPALEEILKEEQRTSDIFSKTRIGLVSFGKSVSMYQLGLCGLASADVYVPSDPDDDDDDDKFNVNTENRAYLTQVDPEDNLTSLKNSLSSIFGVAVEESDDIVPQTSTSLFSSRLAMLTQKKEARLRKEENDEDLNLSTDAKSPWMKRHENNTSEYRKRSTGEALQCAIELANGAMSHPSRTSRIILFTNGCPNIGDGNVVARKDFSQTTKKKEKKPTHDIVDMDMLEEAVEYFDITADFAVSTGIGIDVFCCGVTELALPAYQAMVEPSGGYVIPLVSFDTPQLEHNLNFILRNTYMSKSKNISEEQLDDFEGGAECILDIRSASFITPTQLCGSGEVLPLSGDDVVENEKLAYDEGCELAEAKGIRTKKLPSAKAIELSMTRLQFGRVDPLSTVTVMFDVDDSIGEEDEYAFFQLISRYISRNGDEEITRVCSFHLSVSEDVKDFVSSVDDEAMSVVLAKTAVYRSLHGREETDDARDMTTAGDAEAQEELAHETQADIDVTIQRISGAFRLHCLEEKTRSYSKKKNKKSKSKSLSEGSDSSLDFAFPPLMKETLNRLYHLRRGPLISPGPMSSMDDRAESRGLFLRFPLEDCLRMIKPKVFSTGSTDGVSSPWDKMLPFPAETLILWDDSIVAADFHDTLFIWTGESCKAQRYDGVREEFELLLLEASQDRFPQPDLCVIEDGDSMSRKFTARLAPSHADPIDNQIVHFPELTNLSPEALKKLRSKFEFYDSESDESFRTWFWRVASASNSSNLDGMSLCE